jgi:hypothetical protein
LLIEYVKIEVKMATIYKFKRYRKRLRRLEKKRREGTVCEVLGRMIKQFCIRNFTQQPEKPGSLTANSNSPGFRGP